MKLRAVKSLTYATRRLQAGDVFEAKNARDHKVLLATRKVEAVRAGRSPKAAAPAPGPAATDPAPEPKAPATPPTPDAVGPMTTANMPNAPGADDRAALRVEYERALGKPPFLGWSSDVLREKIAAAKAEPGS